MPKEKKDPLTGLGKKEKKESSFSLEDEEWDKKKIAVGIVIGLLFFGAIVVTQKFILPQLGIFPQRQNVKGAETSTLPPTPEKITLPSSDDVQKKIGEIQDKITHLSVQDIASSSPQVQALLHQIQQLPSLPGNAAKAACVQLCNKL